MKSPWRAGNIIRNFLSVSWFACVYNKPHYNLEQSTYEHLLLQCLRIHYTHLWLTYFYCRKKYRNLENSSWKCMIWIGGWTKYVWDYWSSFFGIALMTPCIHTVFLYNVYDYSMCTQKVFISNLKKGLKSNYQNFQLSNSSMIYLKESIKLIYYHFIWFQRIKNDTWYAVQWQNGRSIHACDLEKNLAQIIT
jgi:hypothetical protein